MSPITVTDERPVVGSWPPVVPALPCSRHWSRRRKTLTAGVGLMVLGLAGGALWLQRTVTTDPELSFGGAALNVFRVPGDADKTGITEISNAVGDEARVAFEPGGRVAAWMSITNGGSRDVEVKEFPRAAFHYWGVEKVVVSRGDGDLFPEGDRPFRAFHLPAGETKYLRVDFRMADCVPAGLQDGHSFVSSLPVTYETLGFTRTVQVPFERAAVGVNTIGQCDKPID